VTFQLHIFSKTNMGDLNFLFQSEPDAQQCSSLANMVLNELSNSKGNFATALRTINGGVQQQVRLG
jgi:hypothetical protein